MTFLYLPSIFSIDLSSNDITYVYKYAFYRLCRENTTDKTVHISFRNNQLTSTSVQKMLSLFQHQESNSDPARPGNNCRATVDLSDNQIKEIFVETLAGLDVLHFPVRIKSDVELKDTKELKNEGAQGDSKLRRFLPSSTSSVENFGFFQDVRKRFKNWNRVRLELSGNPVECTCKLAEEMNFLSFVDETFFSKIQFKNNLDEWMKLKCHQVLERPETMFNDLLFGEADDNNSTIGSNEQSVWDSIPVENSTSGRNKKEAPAKLNSSDEKDSQTIGEFLKLQRTRSDCPVVNYICPLRCICLYTEETLHLENASYGKVYRVNCSNAGFFHFPLFPLRNFSSIDLSFNDLESFDSFPSFSEELLNDYGLDKVIFLNLSSNRIVSLNYFPFYLFSSLTHLDLRHNRLESLPMEMFRHLPLLDHVLLSDNPLTCPCPHPSSTLSMPDEDALRELSDKRKVIRDLERVTCFLPGTWSLRGRDSQSEEGKIFYEDVLRSARGNGKDVLSPCSNELRLPEPLKSQPMRNWNVLYLIVLLVIAIITMLTLLCFTKFTGPGRRPKRSSQGLKWSNWLRGVGGRDMAEKCFIYKRRRPRSCLVLTFRTNISYSNNNNCTAILNSLLDLMGDEHFDKVVVYEIDASSEASISQTMKQHDYWVVVLHSTPFLSVSRDFQLESFSVPPFLKNELLRRLETFSGTLVVIPANHLNTEPVFQEDFKKYSHSIIYSNDAQFGRKFSRKMNLFSECAGNDADRVDNLDTLQKRDKSILCPTRATDLKVDNLSDKY